MVIVVGASEEEFGHVKQYFSDMQCVAESLNDKGTAVSSLQRQDCLSYMPKRAKRTRWLYVNNFGILPVLQ